MQMHLRVAPRHATVEIQAARSEVRRRHHHRLAVTVAGGLLAIAGSIAACSPSASTVPLPSVVLPSVDASAVASAASGAALDALSKLDTAIASAQTAGTLSADDATSLTQLTSGLRTALTSGDTSGAKTALTNLTTKADALSSKLTGDAGTAVKTALDALKGAMAGM